jgi:hypothetical protein
MASIASGETMIQHRDPEMSAPQWIRIAALGAFLALALHGAAGLAHQHGLVLDKDCALCHFGHLPVLQADPPGPSLALAPAGHVADEPWRPVIETVASLHPSRGPPA